MPTYEYVCTACGHEFELVQRMSDPPRKRCVKCGRKVERKIGAGAGIIFKGSGFYITDYRSPEYQAKQKAETSGAKGGSGGGDAGGGSGRGSGSDAGGKSPGGSGSTSGGRTEKAGNGGASSGGEASGGRGKGTDGSSGSSGGTKPAAS